MTTILQQTRVRPHVLTLPALSLAAKYKALSDKMLAWAGVSITAPAIERSRAIVGWFAAHAVHPQPQLHPDGTTENVSVLPAGETWASFNAIFGPTARTNSDTNYWFALYPNGMTMLEALVGTVSAGGVVTDNGMLTEYAPGQWRIRNFTDFRSVQCTLQCKMAQVVLAAQGIHAFDITTVGHDPMAAYDPGTGRWLYIDPTFGEMQKRNGEYLSPLDLLTISLAGDADTIEDEGLPGANYLAQTYFEGERMPGGMSFMTIHTSPQWAGGSRARVQYRFGSLPFQANGDDISGTADQIMPELGCGFAGVMRTGQAVEVRLVTNWPNHTGYQRSLNLGETWAACTGTDYLTPGAGEVRYRSVDALGWSGKEAVVNV